ncbi:MAG TPA: hypothetical protein VIJ29_04640 [Candidatus Paceibacterota bacterium]
MNENPNRNSESYDEEAQAIIDEQLAKYSTPEIASEARRECGPEVAELEAMFASFEEAHDEQVLLALEGPLTVEESAIHPIRRPAQLALSAIMNKLNTIKEETNIPEEIFQELRARRKYLDNVVGSIVNEDGKYMLRHNR